MAPEQFAYLLVVVVSWCWALSQIKVAAIEFWRRRDKLGRWPLTWRTNAAQWITVKAIFITYVGVFAWDAIPRNDGIVYLFFLSQLIAFVHWLRLPSPAKADPVYLKESVL